MGQEGMEVKIVFPMSHNLRFRHKFGHSGKPSHGR
jgi:hypothetical protein